MAKYSSLTNKDTETYSQKINGKVYTIKPGETIRLPRHEAVMVRGHYCGQKKVMLHLVHEPIPDESNKSSNKIYCAPDGKEFSSKSELENYLKGGLRKG